MTSFDSDNMKGSVSSSAGGVVEAVLKVNYSFVRIPAKGEWWTISYSSGSYSFGHPYIDSQLSADYKLLKSGDAMLSAPGVMNIVATRLMLKDDKGELLDEVSGELSKDRLPIDYLTTFVNDLIAKSK